MSDLIVNAKENKN